MKSGWVTLVTVMLPAIAFAKAPVLLGKAADGGYVVPTKQLIRPAGQVLEIAGRPVDMVLSHDGRLIYVKNTSSVAVIDAANLKSQATLAYESGTASLHGIALSKDGRKLYVTTQNKILQAAVLPNGKISWKRNIVMPQPAIKGEPVACGIAISDDDKLAYVCLSRSNSLAVVDLVQGKLVTEISVGVAPYDVVLSRDGQTAYVTNWGGRRAKSGERTAVSSGTDTLVDERGIANSGTVSVIDIKELKESSQVVTGLHPSGLVLGLDGKKLYVTNANSDTISVIDTLDLKVTDEILVRPVASLPFGSAPNALALSKDGSRLYVANGGNNAIADITLADARHKKAKINGFIPTGWYPGAVATDGKNLYVVNVKGIGSRDKKPDVNGYSVYWTMGSINKAALPDAKTLRKYTAQVKSDAQIPQALRALEKAQIGKKPVPVPNRVGEPSTIEHVVYVIKENRTYDQIFGDMPHGNNDPSLCTFGRDVTPNHHALADQFVLLDNFYCNGVVSADGHQWVTQGYTTDYIEKEAGGWHRSYPYSGDDPMGFASSGFIWDNVLLHNLSFRNYGEMSVGTVEPKGASYSDIQNVYMHNTGSVKLGSKYFVNELSRYSCPDFPGWNMLIPEMARSEAFLRDFKKYERRGTWPDFVTIYLPNDHTSGTAPDVPSPAGYLAANDYALGQIIEAITKSKFWSTTCIFVIEDDPQNGYDHVDGHRSICLVVSPYTRRNAVVSEFYNQTSVLHTMELMLGLPPMNQLDASAPVMKECFTNTPDNRPYTCLPSIIPLEQMNPKLSQLSGPQLQMAKQTLSMRWDLPDKIDDDTLNRIIWHSVKGVDAAYPTSYAGAHGKGLKALNLSFSGDAEDDDD
ncbi:MAG: alkaline phosphatase family protein [Armatimonadota bacterium]